MVSKALTSRDKLLWQKFQPSHSSTSKSVGFYSCWFWLHERHYAMLEARYTSGNQYEICMEYNQRLGSKNSAFHFSCSVACLNRANMFCIFSATISVSKL